MIWIAAMIVGLVLLIVLGKVLFPQDHSRAAKLMKTYRHLTPEQLSDVPDEELITAVVSNLLAKAEDERRDPYALIPTLSRERCGVYSIWLVQKELESGDAANLRQSEQFGFSELAADALDWLECQEAAAALRCYLQTAEPTQIERLKTAMATAQVSAHLITLIRNDPKAFCDSPESTKKPELGD